MNIEKNLANLKAQKETFEVEKKFLENFFKLKGANKESYCLENFEEIEKIAKKVLLGFECIEAKKNKTLLSFISELIEEVKKELDDINEKIKQIEKTFPIIEKIKADIKEELEKLKTPGKYINILKSQGYYFEDDDDVEIEEAREREIEKRENWLKGYPFALISNERIQDDLADYWVVIDNHRMRFYEVELDLDGVAWGKKGCGEIILDEEDTLKMFEVL